VAAINYRVYSAAIDADNDIEWHEHVCFNSHADGTQFVSDDEQDEDSTTANANDNQVADDFTYSETREGNIADFFTKELPTQPTNIIKDKDEPLSVESPLAKLLRWHYQLGHLTFAHLWILALIHTIPKWLLTVMAPKCAGCMYGAMTKQPWRMKGIQNKNKIQIATLPATVSLSTNWNLWHWDS
jgi:hypothetical protein